MKVQSITDTCFCSSSLLLFFSSSLLLFLSFRLFSFFFFFSLSLSFFSQVSDPVKILAGGDRQPVLLRLSSLVRLQSN